MTASKPVASSAPTMTGGTKRREQVAEAPKVIPARVWAVVGASFLVFATYVIVSWIFSDDFRPTDPGPTPVPTWMQAALITFMVGGGIAMLAGIWYFLIKPWRREGHLTTDGAFVITFILLYWQDPLSDFAGPNFSYNAWLPNMGSWLGQVPGVIFPQAGRIPEPYLMTGPVYLWWVGGMVVLASWAMRKLKERRPQTGTLGLIGACFAGFLVADFILEIIFLRIGYYAYPSTVDWLTLFPNSYYKFPVYEAVLWGGTWTAFSCLRYFKNDKGQNLAERGIDEVRGSSKKKSLMRFLSIFGAVNVIMLTCYNIPTQFFLVNSDGWPKDIMERSYLVDQFCGEGNPRYACWGEGIPIPRDGSASVNPKGQLVPGEAAIPPYYPFDR